MVNECTLEETLDQIIFDHAEAAQMREHFAGYFEGSKVIVIKHHEDSNRMDFVYVPANATVETTEAQSESNTSNGESMPFVNPLELHRMQMELKQLQLEQTKETTKQIDLKNEGKNIDARMKEIDSKMKEKEIDADLKKEEIKAELRKEELRLREKEIEADLEREKLQRTATSTAKPRTRAKKEAPSTPEQRPAKKQYVDVISPSKDAKPKDFLHCMSTIVADGDYKPWTDPRTREQLLEEISELAKARRITGVWSQVFDKDDGTGAGPCGVYATDAHRATVGQSICRLLWPKTYNQHLDLIEAASAGPKGFPRSLTQRVVRLMLQKRRPMADTMTPTTDVDVLRAAIYLGTEFVDVAKKLSATHSPSRFRMKRVGNEEVPIVYTILPENHPILRELADWLVDPEERRMPSLMQTSGLLPEGLEDLESDGEILRKFMPHRIPNLRPQLTLPRATSTLGRIRDRIAVQAYEHLQTDKVDLPTLAETLNWPTFLQERQAQRAILAMHQAIREVSPAAFEVTDLRRAAIVIYSAVLGTDSMNRGEMLQAIIDSQKVGGAR